MRVKNTALPVLARRRTDNSLGFTMRAKRAKRNPALQEKMKPAEKAFDCAGPVGQRGPGLR
jgi:hypothetical protein